MGRKNRRKKNQVTPIEAAIVTPAATAESNFRESNKDGSSAAWTEMRQMPVGMLEVDDHYQRILDVSRVKYIAAHFNPDLVNIVKVSFRDGHYYVFDGQHTTAAIREKFHDVAYPVLCKIYYGLSVQDEARLFAEQTGFAKSIPVVYKMRAKAVSGDEDINQFLQITRDSGFMIEPAKRLNKAYAIEAVKTAHDCYRTLGAEKYGRMLMLLKLAWHGAKWSTNQKMLSGMCTLIKVFGDDIDTTRFQKKLAVTDEQEVTRAAGQYCNLSAPYRYASAIASLYNNGGAKGTLKLHKLSFAMMGLDS